MLIAHVGGIPVEEILPAVAAPGTTLLVVRAWLTLHTRRKKGPGT
jgi:hypothetical protein